MCLSFGQKFRVFNLSVIVEKAYIFASGGSKASSFAVSLVAAGVKDIFDTGMFAGQAWRYLGCIVCGMVVNYDYFMGGLRLRQELINERFQAVSAVISRDNYGD